uniref:Uncharacterized protein n=1 Tax=Oryctolagus cuniculus TaxID=9986 RepID=A0A5F9DV77_RABIT
MGARRLPRAPAPGPRLKVRAQHPGKVGGEAVAERCARSRPPGEGELWGVRHLVSLSLPASSGACAPPPLPPRRGEGPLLAAAFTAFQFPWGPRLWPPPCFHCLFSRHRGLPLFYKRVPAQRLTTLTEPKASVHSQAVQAPKSARCSHSVHPSSPG